MNHLWLKFLSAYLKDYICIYTFLTFQTPTPTRILNIFDGKHEYFKDCGIWRLQIVTVTFDHERP